MTLEAAEQIIGEKIVTHFWMKPIPPRNFDWVAYKDNDEPDDDGHMLQGWGASEAEADLLEQIVDHETNEVFEALAIIHAPRV